MTTQKTEPDAHGRHWVAVSVVEAAGHPKGRPGPVEYLIALWLIALAGLDVAGMLVQGVIGFQVIWPVIFLFTAVGLAMRLPLAWMLAFICCGRAIWHLFFGVTLATGGGAVFLLINAIIGAGAAFYLFEADRPNLIYRHRYRSYRAESDSEGPEK